MHGVEINCRRVLPCSFERHAIAIDDRPLVLCFENVLDHGRLGGVCVVTPITIRHADEPVEFFAAIGCQSIGFNIEEDEGAGRPRVTERDAYSFWRDLSTLAEASLTACLWDKAVFADCRLSGVELTRCDLRGTDLRENRLNDIRGIASLRGVTIGADQLADLTAAVVNDLDLRVEPWP